jgi:hypothetical protein
MAHRIFALDINGTPTLCFNAADAYEATGICSLDEFRADLMTLSSGGKAICDEVAVLAVRLANEQEITAFRKAATQETASDPVFVFLIATDGVAILDH